MLGGDHAVVVAPFQSAERRGTTFNTRTADRMAAHRKLDQSRDDLCVDEFRRCLPLYWQNVANRTDELNDSAVLFCILSGYRTRVFSKPPFTSLSGFKSRTLMVFFCFCFFILRFLSNCLFVLARFAPVQ